ncbi:S-layer homology domain-containing protein [Brachybacterium vulturis]|uniref:S-layer homology domain-containing protein n=1 Tax=Brachybacterium vulturis TaxID=2017484 RepID=UPI003735DE64
MEHRHPDVPRPLFSYSELYLMSQRHLLRATGAPSSLSRRALLAATAVAVPAGAVAVGAAPALADPAVTDGETRIIDVPLAEVPLVETDGAQVRALAEQPATMVGVTWPDDLEAPEVQARGMDADGVWTPWLPLESTEDPETGQTVAATEVGWIGVVSALQIRAELDGVDVSEQLVAHVVTTSPTAADEQVVALSEAPATDTETNGTDSMQSQPQQMRMMSASVAPNPATPPLVGAPTFTSRAAWGADESRVRSTRGADQLKSVVIHHTAGTNNYSSSQSAQIVRGIQRYHTVTLGWADIGYNMLVSKYGQVFEGRGGGLHRNIVGAHAFGFNTGSFGISVLGDYTSAALPRKAEVAVSQLVGWKLLSTFQPKVGGSTVWSGASGTKHASSGALPRMFGHRDVNYTSCPGDLLYGRFDAIRNNAQDFYNGGWKEHLWAFHGAGGASKLGTVVRSAHRTGRFTATQLTKGLVLQEDGRASGYATPFGERWRASWGRPEEAAFSLGGQTMQKFQHGGVLRTDSSTVFHDGAFLDVPPDLMYREEIEQLAAAEPPITRGWPDSTYRPLAEIQRDAMVAFVYRALGEPAFDPPQTSPFRDMPPSRMFYKEITWAHHPDRGITQGWPDGTFRPTAPVERGAVAAFLYRASRATSTKTSDRFSDVPRDHQFAKEITWLADSGITTGWPDGTFRPVAPITRDAMAAFMIRWMKHRRL